MKLTGILVTLYIFSDILCDPADLKNTKAIFHSGCTIMNDRMYQLGGTVDNDDNILNQFVYSLDLSEPFEIFEGQAPWRIVGGGVGFQGAINPTVISENVNSSFIFMLGGENNLLDVNFFKIFDTQTNSWYDNKDAVLNLLDEIKLSLYFDRDEETDLINTHQLNDLLKKSPYLQTLSANNYEENIVMYGGFKSSNSTLYNTDNFITFVFYYSVKNYTWTLTQTKLPLSFGHNSHIFNNKLLFLGGLKQPKGENFGMNEIRTFDLKTYKEGIVKATGELPPPTSKFLSAKHENYIFTATTKFPISSVYRLNLYTMVWERIDVGLFNIVGEITCIDFYNHFLIVTSANNFTNTYFIDTLSNTVVKKLALFDDYQKEDYTLLIVLSVIGFAMIAGLATVCFYRCRKKRKVSGEPGLSFNLPELLRMELQWNDTISNIRVASIDFSSRQKYFTLDSSESLYNYEIDMDDTNLPKPKMDQAILLRPITAQASRNTLNSQRDDENHTIVSNDKTLFQNTTLLDENDIYFQKK